MTLVDEPFHDEVSHAMAKPNKPKIRIAFVNTHPIQYFAPLYAYLNATGDFSITAIYLSDFSIRGTEDSGFGQSVKWDVDLLSGYSARFVKGAQTRGEIRSFFSTFAPAIWREVKRGNFDAIVVHGHTPAAMLVAIATAKLVGIRIFSRCDARLGLKIKRRWVKEFLRRPLLRALHGYLDGALAIGSANRDFYRAMGVPAEKIFLVPFAVDNDRFMQRARLSLELRNKLRSTLGVFDERPIILFVAKLEPLKRPDDLLRAVALLNDRGHIFHLVVVGSGEMNEELRALVGRLAIGNVHFYGFANQSVLPSLYGASDIFVLPSMIETWGLVVNEAMCAGLPVVVSTEVGCACDLVKVGINGQIFAAGDASALADSLALLVDDAVLRRRMGAASRDIIAGWGYAECAQGLRMAFEKSVTIANR